MQSYYNHSASSSSETETDIETVSDLDSEYESEFESANEILTPSESTESFQLMDSNFNMLSLASSLRSALRSGSTSPETQLLTPRAQTPLAQTPRAMTPVQLLPLSEFEAMKERMIAQLRSATSPEDLITTASTIVEKSVPTVIRGTHLSCKKVVESNLGRLQSDPRGWGLKFIAMCVSCAFGGRLGLRRYSTSLGGMDITSIERQLAGCLNPRGSLNVSCLCYVGHIVLYYWAEEEAVKRALLARFGEGLHEVIKGRDNVIKELGRVHLWAPKVGMVNTWKKSMVIDDVKGRFPKNLEVFTEVMELLGVQV